MDLSLYFWLEHKELFQCAYSDLLGGGAQESFLKMSLVIVFISAIIYSISETSNFIMSLFSFLSLSPAFQENVSSLPALKPLIQYSVVSTFYTLGLSLWLSSKESVCNARDAGDTVWSLDWEDPWRKACILARKIPWTEEPGGLQSIGLQRAGHDWSDWAGTQSCSFLFPLCSLILPINFISLKLWIISFHWNEICISPKAFFTSSGAHCHLICHLIYP